MYKTGDDFYKHSYINYYEYSFVILFHCVTSHCFT